MRPVLVGLACLWLTAGAGAAALSGRRPTQAPTATATIWSGVYSSAQAKRGLLEYARSCEHCHGSNLIGNPTDEVPSLVADGFMFHWKGRTVQDLYARLSKSMPSDAPGSLDAGTYLDLVAYLLEANGFPSGQQDLDRDRLSALVIEKSPPRP
jgi:S-disulfanyl-L-cysteine oxidoreductase SoxD